MYKDNDTISGKEATSRKTKTYIQRQFEDRRSVFICYKLTSGDVFYVCVTSLLLSSYS